MKKCFILFVFSNILLFAQNPSFNGNGDGSEYDPFQIWEKKDLIELADSIDYRYSSLNPTWLYNKHFKLMNDITEPLTESVGKLGFIGHFHGNGKKITLAINFDYYTNQSYALFNGLPSGSIDSLIVDGYVNGNSTLSAISIFINYSSGSITNCINNAIITGIGAGSIVYQNMGAISNCINNGDITGVDRIGGIAGENEGTIINCINTGKITATASGDNNIFSGVGGIVGTVANRCQNISNCVNLGSVVGQGFVGGIVGLANNNSPNNPTPITNCINYGYVRGINIVGGVLGYMFNQNVNVSNCVNVGVVEGEEDTGSIVGKE
ncbi:MAG: hypothetical protein FWG85_02435 [Bacteroidetes bacterium]|nr:hypothetical protein [Bacteroidota bacterium]